MSKKTVCLNNESIAYYSGFNGLEIKKIEYGIEDYIYCVSNAWGNSQKYKYHKLKIYYTDKCDYIKLHNYKIPLNECICI